MTALAEPHTDVANIPCVPRIAPALLAHWSGVAHN